MKAVNWLAVSCLVATTLTACSDIPTTPSSGLSPSRGSPVAANIQQGWIIGRSGGPIEVTYEVVDSLAVFEGDMILGRAGTIPKSREELLKRQAVPQGENFGVVIDWHRWPGGAVPYIIDAAFTTSQRDQILAAMNHVAATTWGVAFFPRTSQDRYIHFLRHATVCNSSVGKQNWGQAINLTTGCANNRISVAHEVLHALGMFHEQSRCDRDGYVTIQWANIQSDQRHNFQTQCDGANDFGPYDEASIMHYPAFNSFAINTGMPTITSNRGFPLSQMGMSSAMTGADVATVNHMYGPFPPTVWFTNPGVSTINWDNNGAWYYTIKLIMRAYEYQADFGSGSVHNEYDVSAEILGDGWPMLYYEDGRPYTGTNQCVVWSDYSGSLTYSYWYEVTAVYHWTQGPTPAPTRIPAPIAPPTC